MFVEYYLAWVVLFMLQKPLFMLMNRAQLGDVQVVDWLLVPMHGVLLDLSVAGYVSVAFGLMMIASVWVSGRVIRLVSDVYTGILLAVAMLALVVDLGLFPYWGFHLDKTLFIYLRTPAEALASGTPMMYAMGLGALAVLWVMTYLLYRHTLSNRLSRLDEVAAPWYGRVGYSLVLLLLTALLFLPIRGSVSVSTMNTGRVYYSDNPMLNTAAINPIFNLVESLGENTIASERYRYMDSSEAEALCRELCAERTDTEASRLRCLRPANIVVLIMESFSANAVGGLYGDPTMQITPCIDSLMKEGIVFEHAYASSFRTDRGVVATLSAFPGQPTSSLMTIPSKTQHLNFLSAELEKAGYQPHFFYGGDEDFTNMRSYLISGGFADRVSDKSFPVSQRLSKWGVNDHIVLDHAAETIVGRRDGGRHLDVILTLSSHEPFEVPFGTRSDNEYLNAIAYTDSAVGAFVRQLKEADRWDSTLVVMVADHGYPYPNCAHFAPERYRILMMMTGGAVAAPERVETICQQTDLIPTVLGEMGLASDAFALSNDVFHKAEPWAFYSYVDGFVLMTEQDTCRVDGKTGMRECGSEASERKAKAYMQTIYEMIDRL